MPVCWTARGVSSTSGYELLAMLEHGCSQNLNALVLQISHPALEQQNTQNFMRTLEIKRYKESKIYLKTRPIPESVRATLSEFPGALRTAL